MSKKFKLKKGHNSKEISFELSPLIVWIVLWRVNTYSEFQVNIFSNNRDIKKCLLLHDAKAIAILRVFSENTRSKIDDYRLFLHFQQCFQKPYDGKELKVKHWENCEKSISNRLFILFT